MKRLFALALFMIFAVVFFSQTVVLASPGEYSFISYTHSVEPECANDDDIEVLGNANNGGGRRRNAHNDTDEYNSGGGGRWNANNDGSGRWNVGNVPDEYTYAGNSGGGGRWNANNDGNGRWNVGNVPEEYVYADSSGGVDWNTSNSGEYIQADTDIIEYIQADTDIIEYIQADTDTALHAHAADNDYSFFVVVREHIGGDDSGFSDYDAVVPQGRRERAESEHNVVLAFCLVSPILCYSASAEIGASRVYSATLVSYKIRMNN